MTLLIAKATFDYDGDKHEPGDVLTVPDTGEALKDAEYFTSLNLCEAPTPRNEEVQSVAESEYLLCEHGGGWYSIIDEGGEIVVDTVQGREEAIAAIPSDSEPTE